MSLFIPTIPTSGQNLDFSQGQLLSNNSGLDTVFGIDHYKFSDATANKGFHNQVTTPPYVANPPTSLPPVTGSNPILYSFQQSANLGVIQYSRGPSNAVPTPVTMLQSPAIATIIAPSGTSNVFDFATLSRSICILTAVDTTLTNRMLASLVMWTGTVLVTSDFVISSFFKTAVSGSILQILNNSGVSLNNVYWTLQFMRVQ